MLLLGLLLSGYGGSSTVLETSGDIKILKFTVDHILEETNNKMNFEILLADYKNKSHAADIIYLLDAYSKDPMGGGSPLSDFSKDNLIKKLSNIPHAFSVLCYVDNKPAGLINCFEVFSTFQCRPLINIHDVIVIAEFRGLGISQLMMKEVEGIARTSGCCKITLEVLERNEVAKNSYKKFGFVGYELNPLMGRALYWEKSIRT